jgi:hypothetical protein
MSYYDNKGQCSLKAEEERSEYFYYKKKDGDTFGAAHKTKASPTGLSTEIKLQPGYISFLPEW